MALTKRALVLGATAVAVSAMFVACVQINGTFSKAATFLSLTKSGMLQENPKELVDEVWQVIDTSYVDGTFNQTDWRAVRKDYLSRSYSSKPEAYGAIRDMLKKLGDPYTRFMDPDEFRNMKIDTSGELTGVGIQLAADDKTKKLTVVAPIDGSPAATAGIRPKDIITKIDEQSTDGMDDKKAVTLIRGPIGTKVKLTVLRGTQTLEFDLKRDKIEIHPVRSNVQKAANGSSIGYIRLVQFNANAPREMRDAIQNLEKQQVSGYVLDLRSNPGGLLNASVDIARMWLQKGGIVSTVDRQGEADRQAANNSALTEKPMVVLVDGGSASASEILSGALQDNKRGKIVGLKTFGKGLVQSVRDLGDNESGMAVTIAKYLTPNGRDIHKHGIDPDVEVKLTEPEREELIKDRDKIGTPADPQFAKALQVLQQGDVAKTS
jgi:carboxyl-terminal processing protease